MKTKILIIILLALGINSEAQTDVDALRYSGSSITGTSRFTAMSGAFGALGGDFTTLSYNPAGIAVFRSSEFTFTPSIFVGSTTSNFLGREYDENKYNFNFGNVGLIYTRKLTNNETEPGWKSWNFGIGYNRLDNFHNRSFYEGRNVSNSMLDDFVENANGIDPNQLDPFFESLAYNTYQINPDQSNQYTNVIPLAQEIQRKSTENLGAIGETVFSFGANYSNKFYLGGTFGVKSLRFVETSTYEEFDPDTIIPYFKRFIFQQDLTTRGVGIDLKFGIIYKANDIVRFGIAIESPTWYSMHDDFVSRMTGILDTGSVQSYYSEAAGVYDYDLTTPFKALGSIAVVFGKQGLVSADYQYSDCGDSRFDAYGATFADVNNSIRTKYQDVHTIRIGTEWVYQNLFFRGGFSYATSPMNNLYKVSNSDFSKKSYTGGIGFRENNLFFDLGYAYTASNQFYQPYTLNYEDVAGVKTRLVSSNFTLTMGVKF